MAAACGLQVAASLPVAVACCLRLAPLAVACGLWLPPVVCGCGLRPADCEPWPVAVACGLWLWAVALERGILAVARGRGLGMPQNIRAHANKTHIF